LLRREEEAAAVGGRCVLRCWLRVGGGGARRLLLPLLCRLLWRIDDAHRMTDSLALLSVA